MALLATELKRQFILKKNGSDIKIEDPNPGFTPEEVMMFLSNQYPELTTSTVIGPNVENDVAKFEFKTTVGTKG